MHKYKDFLEEVLKMIFFAVITFHQYVLYLIDFQHNHEFPLVQILHSDPWQGMYILHSDPRHNYQSTDK